MGSQCSGKDRNGVPPMGMEKKETAEDNEKAEKELSEEVEKMTKAEHETKDGMFRDVLK